MGYLHLRIADLQPHGGLGYLELQPQPRSDLNLLHMLAAVSEVINVSEPTTCDHISFFLFLTFSQTIDFSTGAVVYTDLCVLDSPATALTKVQTCLLESNSRRIPWLLRNTVHCLQSCLSRAV